MLMLKRAQNEIIEKSIQNCFRKAEISPQSQESAMDENDNLLKEVI